MFHTLNIGAESLYANRQGVDTAGHNIANAQTEGFSRQKVNLTQRIPSEIRGYIRGNGVLVESIERTHDKFIEKQLNTALQDKGMSGAHLDAMKGIEQIYGPDIENSVAEELTDFFNALQTMSGNPAEMPVRTNVKESAQDLANAFKRVDTNLHRHRSDLNEKTAGIVQEVNDLVGEIGKLNVAILTLEAGRGEAANDLRDQQDRMLRQLSERIDISYYKSDHGTTIVRGPNQALLVDGKLTGRVETISNPDTGMFDVVVAETDSKHMRNITNSIESGSLRAVIDVRDRLVPELLHKNNELAASVAFHVNGVHREGYGVGDFKETKGRDFFEMPTDIKYAARDLKLSAAVSEDINAISAAATPNAPGDNVIANEMIRLRSSKVMSDGNMTFNEFFANGVGILGLEVERASQQMQADDVIVGDLSARREAISGVSLDEEAVNLLRWQTAFAASSKVITTTDEMLETVLSLKR